MGDQLEKQAFRHSREKRWRQKIFEGKACPSSERVNLANSFTVQISAGARSWDWDHSKLKKFAEARQQWDHCAAEFSRGDDPTRTKVAEKESQYEVVECNVATFKEVAHVGDN